MRILYLGWLHEGGIERNGPTYEAMNFPPALRRMGHAVDVLDLGASLRSGVPEVTEALKAQLKRKRYDLLFTCLVHDDIDADALSELTARGDLITFNWFCDDHWRLEDFSTRWAPRFTWVSTTDPAAPAKYAAKGHHNVLLTQWAANADVYRPAGRPLAYDVTFVGQVYGERQRIINALRRDGLDVRAWGAGWDLRLWHRVAGRVPVVRGIGGREWHARVRSRTRLSRDDMIAVFEQSRVNLNLAAASHGVRSQVKGRVFEVPAAGGFLLTEAAEGIHELFRPDEEIGVFNDVADLQRQVRWWLSHDDARARAAVAAHRRVLAEHTYQHRFSALFGAMNLAGQ
jgi:spore maturation protein CgeB